MNEQLQNKIDKAIRLLKAYDNPDEPVEIAYSGGKDSDVILQLAKEAGIQVSTHPDIIRLSKLSTSSPDKLDKTDNVRIDYSEYTNQELKDMADKIDKDNNIHVNNRQRLERYITYYKQTGKTIKKTNDINKKLYDFDIIGLKSDRETLYKRMNDRVDIMLENGLLEEAKSLKDKKNFNNIIGYKELNQYFNGSISLDEAIDLIKQNTRRYSKRQFTWFNNQMKDIKWFDVNYNDFNETIKEIDIYLQEKR